MARIFDLLIALTICVTFGISDQLPGWGPFEVVHDSLIPCRGHKRIDITSMYLRLEVNPLNGKGYLYGNNTNLKAGGPLISRLRSWKWVNNRFEAALTITAEKCQNFPKFLKYVVEETRLADKRCYLVPGFSLVNLDLSAIERFFWETGFFYGRYKFRISVFTQNENVWCYDIQAHFVEPKKFKLFMENFNKSYKNITD